MNLMYRTSKQLKVPLLFIYVLMLWHLLGTAVGQVILDSNSSYVSTLVDVARKAPSVQIAVRALAGSGHTLNWNQTSSIKHGAITVLIVPANDLPLRLMLGFEDNEVVTATLHHYLADGYPVCHTPPDNPQKAWTIYVSFPALSAHLNHGDTNVPCEQEPDGGTASVEIAYVNLMNNVVGRSLLGPGGDINVLSTGEWAGTDTLEALTTPVPYELPEWIQELLEEPSG